MTDTMTPKPAAWSDEAARLGRQAMLDAEARLRASRSPAERAGDLTDVESARLGELRDEADLARASYDASVERLHNLMPRSGQDGMPIPDGVGTVAQLQAATADISIAEQVAARAQGRLSDYQTALGHIRQARRIRASQGPAR